MVADRVGEYAGLMALVATEPEDRPDDPQRESFKQLERQVPDAGKGNLREREDPDS